MPGLTVSIQPTIGSGPLVRAVGLEMIRLGSSGALGALRRNGPGRTCTRLPLTPLGSRTRAIAGTPAAAMNESPPRERRRSLFTEDEPTAPRVSTAIPGPKGQQALEELDRIFDARSVNFVADYRRSMGN